MLLGTVSRIYPVILAALLLGLIAGCTSGDDTSPSGRREPAQTSTQVPRRAANLLVEAKAALKKGQFRRALALTDSAASEAPEGTDLSPLPFFRGRVFSQLKQYEYARKSFLEAVERRPGYRGAWYQLGNLAFQRAKYQDALEYYQNERKHQGRHARISYQIGRCFSHMGKRDSARQAFRRTLTQDSTFARAWMELSTLEDEHGNYKPALQYARRALQFAPDNTEYRYQKAYLLFQMGRIAESTPLLKQVIADDSSHQGAHYYLGQALARQGQTAEAKKKLARAENLRKLNKRIDNLESQAKIYSQQPDRWMKLGSALRRAGRVREAIEAYTIAQTLQPQNRAVHDSLTDLRRQL